MKRIKYEINGNILKVRNDDYGWGEQLCVSVLDNADWAECIDAREYRIADAELDFCRRFLEAFNASEEDDEFLCNTLSDWTLLI